MTAQLYPPVGVCTIAGLKCLVLRVCLFVVALTPVALLVRLMLISFLSNVPVVVMLDVPSPPDRYLVLKDEGLGTSRMPTSMILGKE